MKKTLKISLVALIAMLTFSTMTYAQFGLGTIISSARALADKDPDAEIPQPVKKGKPIILKWQGETPIGTWNPQTLEITFAQKWDEGELAGKNVIYKVDPETGAVIRNDGVQKGSMSNDGTIESPNLGTLQFDTETNAVMMNGEKIGTAGPGGAQSFDHTIGSFESKVSPLLSAFVWFGLLTSENQVATWKAEQAEAEAKAEQERAEREALRAELEEQYAEDLKECSVTIESSSRMTAGRVRKGTVESSSFSTIGYIKKSSNSSHTFVVENSSQSTIGYIKCTGISGDRLKWRIENSSQSTLATFDGRRFDGSNTLTAGYYKNGTVEDSSQMTIGYIKGTDNPVIVAACCIFFNFFEKK